VTADVTADVIADVIADVTPARREQAARMQLGRAKRSSHHTFLVL
jgi:hypothetical protein